MSYRRINLFKSCIFTAGLLLIIGIALPTSASALSPEMEADRLLLSAAENLGNFEATEKFEEIRHLGVELPVNYFYHYGKHLYKTGNLEVRTVQ